MYLDINFFDKNSKFFLPDILIQSVKIYIITKIYKKQSELENKYK